MMASLVALHAKRQPNAKCFPAITKTTYVMMPILFYYLIKGHHFAFILK